MQKNEQKDVKQSSVGTQQSQPKKGDLNQPQKQQTPGSSSSRIEKEDENFGASKTNRPNK